MVQAKHTARKILANNVKNMRHLQRWSQEELAYRSGLHRTFIGHVECGVRNISIDNIEKIARAFDVPVDRMLVSSPADAPTTLHPGGVVQDVLLNDNP